MRFQVFFCAGLDRVRCLAILLFGLSLMVSQSPGFADTRSDAVDQLFKHWSNDDSPGAAVAVVKDGKILFAKGYGQANLEHRIPNSANSIFHVASVSKQFTAFAIYLLQQDGKLSLDDDIRKHIPEIHDFGKTITIRHLIHHTSGLRDQWELLIYAGWRMDDVITHNDVIELVTKQRELNFDPGERYLYCNTGYTLMAEIVKRVSGESLRVFCQKRIFDPLEMKETHFHDDHRQIVRHRTDCYSKRGNKWQKAVLSYAIVGATSLFTTAKDLAKWQNNFETKKLGDDDLFKEFLRKGRLNNGQEISYASGIMHGKLGEHSVIAHSGGDAGYRCHLMRVPSQNLSVIVLGNAANMPTGSLANQVALQFLKKIDQPAKETSKKKSAEPPTKKKEAGSQKQKSGAPRPAKSKSSGGDKPIRVDLKSLVGRYRSSELDVAYELLLNERDQLMLNRRKYGTQRCFRNGANRFRVRSGMVLNIEVQTDPKTGQPTALLFNSARVKNLKFEKE